jgi:ribosomal protein S18 acetylase RimI-like enzyme
VRAAWTVENGALWAIEPCNGLPPLRSARVELEFKELGSADADDLAAAMNLDSPELIQQRLQKNRRCFCLRAAGQIAAYGWVTRGAESVGELEREFHLCDDEAYIWDCGTVPAWRRQGCYTALLSQLIYQLHGEELRRIWIGASRRNTASIRAFTSAGFQPVVDVSYCRCYRLTLMWIHQARSAGRSLVAAADRILLNNHERRFGRLAIGYKR